MSRAILTAWLNEHQPELAARIANMPLELVRKVLNNETGLNIGPDANVDESCVQYLAALQLALQPTKLPPKINAPTLLRWNAQRGQRNGRKGRYKRLPSRKNLSKWVAGRIIEEILEEEKAR